MKSERRHELQHNALADWLYEYYEKIRPYTNAIVGVLALALLALAGWLYWSQTSALNQGAAWNKVFEAQAAGEPAKLSDVAEQHGGTSAADWANVMAGDMYLASGCDQLFTNKANATNELNKAVASYQKALKESQQSTLRERATFGLARAYEALSGTPQSGLDKAIQNYEEVVKQWPKGIFAKTAQQRLNDLKSSATKKFYDQFAKYDPKPAFTEQPGQKLQFDPNALPEPGSLTLPGETKSEPAPSEPVMPGLPSESAAPSAGQPAQPPAAEKPSEPKPAAEPKPPAPSVPAAPPAKQ